MTPEATARLLDTCAQEPIRVPGATQPHGAIVVLDPDTLAGLQASRNARLFAGIDVMTSGWDRASGSRRLAGELRSWLAGPERDFFRTVIVEGRDLQVTAHRGAQGVVVEFEAPPSSEKETLEALYPRLQAFVETLGSAAGLREIAEAAVREMRTLTGFNRVMLYSFDEEGAGTVLAEDRDDALPSYLDLRFPASDIPAQARELYRLNRIRLIPDANYQPVPIDPVSSPVDGRPLDLSLISLRSVSPVHLEYMRNMGTLSSMSISILVDGELWGLISCHNAEPRQLNAQIRNACDFLGQIISLQIGSRERAADDRRRIALKRIESGLLAALSNARAFEDDLSANAEAWMQLVDADGAALVTQDRLVSVGSTPSENELLALAAWLRAQMSGDLFVTDSLVTHWPPAVEFAGIASGCLAISISQLHPSYIIWFREERIRTVKWAGDPNKNAQRSTERLHPRQSFELWKEQVRNRSLAWTDIEIDTARDFRNSVVNFVLLRAEERAQMSEQLQASNKELEAFSYSISHDLRAPFRHIAGYAELLTSELGDLQEPARHYLKSIVSSAVSAGQLVDDLLSFSHMGRTQLVRTRIDMNKLVDEIKRSRELDLADRKVDWRISRLPEAWGDRAMIRQAMANLIDNAIKYTAPRANGEIVIDGSRDEGGVSYTVSDNGVGFEMNYVHKLFGVFQRLHRMEDFPGNGIGLALVKRIVERHGGRAFAEAVVDKGARVGFSLPAPNEENVSA